MRFLPGTHRTKTTPGVHIKLKCFISEKLCQTLHNLPESELAHSCEMSSLYCLSFSTPPPQPTVDHRRTLLAITSLIHKFKSSMGQMPFRTVSPSLTKGQERSAASICSDDSVHPDPSMVIVQGSSHFSSIFCVTSTAVGNSLLSQ